MGTLMAILGFAILGLGLVIGGIQTMRHGLEISKGKKLSGTGGKVVGVLLILLGVGLTVGAAIYLQD